jgi:hypothetical protein
VTLEEFWAACKKARQNRIDCELDPDEAYLVIVMPGRHGRPFRRKRIAPGLYGRVVGEQEAGKLVVDVRVQDVERWLRKAKRT